MDGSAGREVVVVVAQDWVVEAGVPDALRFTVSTGFSFDLIEADGSYRVCDADDGHVLENNSELALTKLTRTELNELARQLYVHNCEEAAGVRS